MALTYRGQLDRPLTAEEIDGNFAYFTGSHGITGSIGISGSIIPAVGVGETTSSFSLGSPTAAWKDIYVSEGSIKFIKSGSEEVVKVVKPQLKKKVEPKKEAAPKKKAVKKQK